MSMRSLLLGSLRRNRRCRGARAGQAPARARRNAGRNRVLGHHDRARWRRAAAWQRHGRQGEAIYVAKCQGCHGVKGTGGPNLALAGGNGTIGQANQLKTIGSFWPYATTIFDYVFTSMPYQETKSLTHDETTR